MVNLKIINVSGIASREGSNEVKNVLDASPDTFFAGKNISIELEKQSKFDTIAVGHYGGGSRRVKFSISTLPDNKDLGTFTSAGITASPEEYTFKTVTADGVKLTFLGSGSNNIKDFTNTKDDNFAIAGIAVAHNRELEEGLGSKKDIDYGKKADVDYGKNVDVDDRKKHDVSYQSKKDDDISYQSKTDINKKSKGY
jgi:hypothetical protein